MRRFVAWICTTKARLTHTLTHRFPPDVSGMNVLIFSIAAGVCSSESQELARILWNSRCPIPCSQEFAAFAYQEPDQSSPRNSNWFNLIRFNIILPFRRTSSWWCIFITLFNHSPLRIFLSPIRVMCPAHFIILDLIAQVIWWGEQIMKLLNL